MALTADQLAAIRDVIGDTTPPTDADLQAVYDRKGESLTLTALQVLEKRYNTLAAGGPLQFSVAGEYSENRAANMTALEKLIARVRAEGIGGEPGVMAKVQIGSLGRRWGQ